MLAITFCVYSKLYRWHFFYILRKKWTFYIKQVHSRKNVDKSVPCAHKINFREKGSLWKSCRKNYHFFQIMGDVKSSFFEKVINITFFRGYVSVTQNGHFFPKNVGKMFDKNSENYVLIRENPFYEKWQSGRINFFWGGFSAFMVYALSLISVHTFALWFFWSVLQKNHKAKVWLYL